jgi:hypothetical protein
MARIRVLTALKIRQNLKPGMYADGLGLYLKVRPGNSKSWIFRYRTGGKLRDMGLGPLQTVLLAEAREKAEVCRAMRLKGLDPLEEGLKEQQAKVIDAAEAITFEKCAETYIADHKDGWKNGKHADQWTAMLQTYVYPVFMDKPVASIDDALVLKVLQPIWKEKTETASRVRGRIERILGWARVKKYRAGDNPARWKGHLDHLLPKRSKVATIVHHAALPIDETPGFIQVLRREETVVARAFEFCILGARARQTWNEHSVRTITSTLNALPAAMEYGRE